MLNEVKHLAGCNAVHLLRPFAMLRVTDKLKSMVSATHIYKSRAKRTTLFTFQFSVFSLQKAKPFNHYSLLITNY